MMTVCSIAVGARPEHPNIVMAVVNKSPKQMAAFSLKPLAAGLIDFRA
jgi:hypothetical protein